jgi:hypothetical protein
MPRTPLGTIDGNRRRSFELSEALHLRIAGAAENGVSPADISRNYKIPYDTVYYTIQRDLMRQNGKSLPRSGMPKKYGRRLKRKILRFIRKVPKATYEKIRQECDTKLSDSTLSRIIKNSGFKNWLCKRRPFLTIHAVYTRYRWCRERKEWVEEQWSDIIFSDECSLERGAGAQREWAFRTPAQKWDKEMITTYKKSKDISVMIWGAIWIRGRLNIIFMEQDSDSKKEGYSARLYISVLNNQLPRC